MKRRMNFLFILAILLALPLTALAAPVGKITALEGNVDITAGSKARDAKLGEAVNTGDILRAKSKSKAQVTFLDGNILRLGENTRVRITDYQSGARKTSILDLFRGKTQNIVSRLAKGARYEVRTPTAVCGVRGTNFIAFFQNGISGFAPREGTIYGYNRTMPETVRTVTAGLAIMVLATNQPPTIQPMSSTDLDGHMQDTTPMGPQGAPPSGGETTTAPTTTPTTVADTPPPPPPPPPLPTMRNTLSTVPTTMFTTAPTTISTTVSTTVPTTLPTTSTTTVLTTVPTTSTTTVQTTTTVLPTTSSTTTVQTTTVPPTTIPPTTVPPTTIPPTTTSSTTVPPTVPTTSTTTVQTTAPTTAPTTVPTTTTVQTTVPTTVTTTIQTTVPTTVTTTSTTTIQTTVPTTISTTVLTTVPTTSTTTILPTAIFPPHAIGTPVVVFSNTDPNVAPDTGTIGLAMQYDLETPTAYYTPVKEVGGVMWQGTGNIFLGFLTSLPGSWMGATSGLFYNEAGTQFGLFLGSLSGSYNGTTGILTASGGLTRTPFLMASGPQYTGHLYDGLLGYLPGFSSISVGVEGPSYITAGAATLVPDYTTVNMTDQHFIEALATTDIGAGLTVTPPAGRPSAWWARYGYASGDSFLVGGVTGSETVFNNILLSGRDLLYIDPKVMGYANFEYWANLAGANPQTAGAATIEVKPLAFGGYWGGYDMSGGVGCLLYNDGGFTVHAGDEWGLIGSWESPWAGPAAIKVAGTFGMDPVMDGAPPGNGLYPGYLWNSPINSRGYGYTGFTSAAIDGGGMYTYPDFASGEYFGYTAGRIGKFENSVYQGGIGGERLANGALAAVYVKDGKAGFLTTFDPGEPTVTGGLAGYFFPNVATGDSGYWRLDGTLTATQMATSIPGGGLSGREWPFSMMGAYNDEAISLFGDAFGYTFSLYPTLQTPQQSLPWGIYALEFGGRYSVPTRADLNGKNIAFGGGYSLALNGNGYFLGTLKNTSWTATIPGSVDVRESGQITGLFDGVYLSETEMGTFRGPFAGLYDEDEALAVFGSWIGESVGTYERTRPFAFSSPITATTDSLIGGIMGGANTDGGPNDLWMAKASDLWFMGTYDSSMPAPALWTGKVSSSYSTIGGVYLGSLNLAVNDLNNLSGGLMALYTKSGKAGVLFSDDVSGTAYPTISMWDAGGTLQLYEMGNVGITEADLADPAKLKIFDIDNNYQVTPGKPVITAISGGLIDVQNEKTKTMRITGETWGIWSSTSKGTYTGTTPENWVSVREEGSFAHGGSSGAEYLNVSMPAPVNGVSTGTVAGAWMLSNDPNPPAGIPASYTVVAGGAVKGLFNPSDPKTSMILSQGAFMETKAFINMVSGMDDAERTNFMKATKIPAFQVGVTDLRGDSNVTGGNIDLGSAADPAGGIRSATFFALTSGGAPRIWASGSVTGTFTGTPAGGTVPLSGYAPGTGTANGITANFNVTQWSATTWGATVTNGSAPVNSLTGSQGFVTTNAVGFQGGAAGSVNTPAGTFSGTAAGIVRQP